MAVCTRSIAAAYKESVEIRMVMVSEYGYEPVFPGEGMHRLKSFLGPFTAVKEIAEVD
jgi:hypothetical protein